MFWDVVVDKENGEVLDSFNCLFCNVLLKKIILERVIVIVYDKVLKEYIV